MNTRSAAFLGVRASGTQYLGGHALAHRVAERAKGAIGIVVLSENCRGHMLHKRRAGGHARANSNLLPKNTNNYVWRRTLTTL